MCVHACVRIEMKENNLAKPNYNGSELMNTSFCGGNGVNTQRHMQAKH